jgi:exodeoxyribonuclease VII large subunit
MEAPRHIPLSQLAGIIQQTIQQSFNGQYYWVVADVANHSFKETSNYHYFELVEKAGERGDILARFSAKAWGLGSTKLSRFQQETGQRFGSNIRVLVQVSVVYHPRFGLQLELQDIDPNFTLGAMEAQRRETLRKLVTEHPGIVQLVDGRYVTQNQGIRLPAVIQRVALVSAAQSAGAEDFRHSLAYNEHGYRFFLDEFHAPVQGEHHAETLLECLVKVFTCGKPFDAVVLIRGGGAQTDFLIFDDYMIGLAIAKFPIPVITGIGHQKNETIADLMAHTALKTPTKAAEFIIAHNRAFEDRLLGLQKTVVIKSQQIFSAYFQALSAMHTTIVHNSRLILSTQKDQLSLIREKTLQHTRHMLYNWKGSLLQYSSTLTGRPRSILANRRGELDNTIGNLRTFHAQYLKNQQGYLNHLKTVIKLMNPNNILRKGFAMVKVEGRITSDPEKLRVGQPVEIILSETQINATIRSKTAYHGNEFDL